MVVRAAGPSTPVAAPAPDAAKKQAARIRQSPVVCPGLVRLVLTLASWQIVLQTSTPLGEVETAANLAFIVNDNPGCSLSYGQGGTQIIKNIYFSIMRG
jgi:hypothetical protein